MPTGIAGKAALFISAFIIACSGDDDDGSGGSGGSIAPVGGTAGTPAVTGGAPTTGGTTSSVGGSAVGGSSTNGGAPSAGGASAAGGANAAAGSGGGPTASGGSPASGGGGGGAAGETAAGAPGAAGVGPGSGGSTGGGGVVPMAGAGGAAGNGATAGAGFAGGTLGEGGAAGTSGTADTCPDGVPLLESASLPDGFCAWTWAAGIDTPRGIITDEAGDVLVLERGASRVVVLSDDDGDGRADDGVTQGIANASGLNHGVALWDGMLYASSATTVYRWPYAAGARDELGDAETVVTGLPNGGHSTRTLVFDSEGRLYVSIGSGGNVDEDSSRSRIVRYDQQALASGATFGQGEVFADGLRNEVGLRFDDQGRLWGIENGLDNLNRADLGGDIHNDNPGEELNLFAEAGRFYGYPYCWSEYLLPQGVGQGTGTQWVHPDFMGDGVHDDEWCREVDNVVPPVLTLQAHVAPLDILFYYGSAFPSDYVGDLIVGYHGSWNRTPQAGYKVVRVPFGDDGMPTGEVTPLLEYGGSGDTGDDWPHRPVALTLLPNGVLLVTSDASNQIIAIGYDGG